MGMLKVTKTELTLAGYNVRFRVERDVDGACLYIQTPECDHKILLSHGQYFALEAAIHDVVDTEMVGTGQYGEFMKSGTWFGNSE